MHLGDCRIFGLNISEKDVEDYLKKKYLEKYEIEATILQPFPGASNPREVHDKIASLARKFNGRVYGLVSVNPRLEYAEEEVERALKDLKFVGVKVHTIGHSLHPQNPYAKLLWDLAAKYKVPVMVHTGPGVPFANPTNVVPRLEEYPEVKVILAHAGFGFFAGDALILAKKYDNVYLEISWTPTYDLPAMLTEVPDRVVFGSDLVENTLVELAKFESIKVPEEVKRKALYHNAKELFKL